MKKFERKVDRRNRKAMIDFLSGHFRYNTMNGWNLSTSYANNMKVGQLGLTYEQEMKLLEIMECEGAYDGINELIREFGYQHDWQWQVGFNGRSGGYLVLYRGGWKPDEYKSFCTVCGQRNFRTVEETGCRCGRCGNESRRNYEVPPKQIYTMPGKSVDMDESFEDWSIEELRKRVQLVEEFDRLCDDIISEAVWMADNMEVEEQEVHIPTVQKILKEAAVC